jgi:hypothetical protein
MWRDVANRRDHTNLCHNIDRRVRNWVVLAAHMTGLGGKIEDSRGALAVRSQVDLAHIGTHQIDLYSLQIRGIGSAPSKERV